MAIRTSFEVAKIVTRWEPVNTVDRFILRRSVKMGSGDIGVIRVHIGGSGNYGCDQLRIDPKVFL